MCVSVRAKKNTWHCGNKWLDNLENFHKSAHTNQPTKPAQSMSQCLSLSLFIWTDSNKFDCESVIFPVYLHGGEQEWEKARVRLFIVNFIITFVWTMWTYYVELVAAAAAAAEAAVTMNWVESCWTLFFSRAGNICWKNIRMYALILNGHVTFILLIEPMT